MKTKLLLALSALFFSFSAVKAKVYSGECGDNLTWTLDTSTGLLKIEGSGRMRNYFSSSSIPWYNYSSYIKNINILNGVTSIGYNAFYDCSGLTSVTIGNGVTSIGNNAFRDCSSLTSITIPNSVTSIGDYAFYGCSGLTSITIPNGVTSIGERAFDGCKLRTVVAKSINPQNYSDAFSSNTYTYATLYVPEGCFWNYAYDCPWTFEN